MHVSCVPPPAPVVCILMPEHGRTKIAISFGLGSFIAPPDLVCAPFAGQGLASSRFVGTAGRAAAEQGDSWHQRGPAETQTAPQTAG